MAAHDMYVIDGVRVREDEAEALGYVIPKHSAPAAEATEQVDAKARTPENKARTARTK